MLLSAPQTSTGGKKGPPRFFLRRGPLSCLMKSLSIPD
jgi:hypothetical protein